MEMIFVGAGLASTPANWNLTQIPTTGDKLTFNSTSQSDCIYDINLKVDSITLEEGYSGVVTSKTANKKLEATSIIVNGGAIVLQEEDDLVIPEPGTTAITGARSVTLAATNADIVKKPLPILTNICPICFSELTLSEVWTPWTDDPIPTKTGCPHFIRTDSGIRSTISQTKNYLYKGLVYVKGKHIEELQQKRAQQEIDFGIIVSERTSFTSAKDDLRNKWTITKKHIRELRESTEKLLAISGQTKEEYFNYDKDGMERNTDEHQLDWNDLELTDKDIKIPIKNIHIEDIRHAIIDTITPMFLFNGGLQVTTGQEGDTEVNIAHNTKALSYYAFQSAWIAQWVQLEGVNGVSDDIGFPYKIYSAPQVDGIWVLVNPANNDWRRIVGKERVAYTNYWRAYRRHFSYSAHSISLKAVPKTNNKNIKTYEIQELNASPVLIDETLGYPCIMYAGDTNYYAVPKDKSAPFIEDVISTIEIGNLYNMTRIEGNGQYSDTVIFKDNGLAVNSYITGVAEPAFDERQMDRNSWGLSDPTSELVGEIGYMKSVSFRATNSCGNYSFFLPKKIYDRLSEVSITTYIQEQVLFMTLIKDPGVHNPSQPYFIIDITQEHMIEGDVIDPSTGNIIVSHFGSNFLLAKNDGAIVARGYETKYKTLSEEIGDTVLLPENSIARTAVCYVNEVEWTQVDNFDSSSSDSEHYVISENIVNFGNNIKGKYPISAHIIIEVYTNELVPYKVYAGGKIILPYSESLANSQVFVLTKYYNIPTQYYEFTSPITEYKCSYYDKPEMNTIDAGSIYEANWEGIEGILGPYGTPSSGRDLQSQTKEQWVYLHP